MRETRRFTDTEDAYIRAHGSGTSATAIARHLGRRPASVVSRQITLGIRQPNRTVRRFCDAEDAALRDGAGRVSLREVARRIGRKPSSCYGRAKTLGISYAPAMRSASPRLKDGYWWLPVMDYGRRVWKTEHRHVMERHIGRDLQCGERVHHIDLDRSNNRIDNLYLCRSESEHRSLHNRLEKALGTEPVVRRLLELGILTFDHAGGGYKICGTSS